MTETPRQDPVADAVTALTAAARARRTTGSGTPDEDTVPADFADIAARALTAVAANVGGAETLLAGRPGSWEASLVRQILYGTAGHDEAGLLAYRTEPFRVVVDVDAVFDDFGLTDLYNEALDQADGLVGEADDDLFDAVATAGELARHDEIYGWVLDPGADATDAERERAWQQAHAINEAITQRAVDAGSPLVAALGHARRARDAVEELWDQDLAAYRDAYVAVVAGRLEARGLTTGVEAIDWPGHGDHGWDQLTGDLHEHATATALLPQSGEAPDWSHGLPADALRRAGLTYTARAGQTDR